MHTNQAEKNLYLTQKTSEQKDLPGGSMVKNTPVNAEDVRNVGWVPGLGRSTGGGSGNPVISCLKNSMERGAWRATVHGVAKSRTRLSK